MTIKLCAGLLAKSTYSMAINSKLYGYAWQKYRKQYLRQNPLCAECAKLGKVTAATVIDHIQKHNNDLSLFWDEANHQPLCANCHNSWKQSLEKSGVSRGCDVNGIPLDKNHFWNK